MNPYYKTTQKLTIEIQHEFRLLYDRLQLHELSYSSLTDEENLKKYQDIARDWKALQEKHGIEVTQDAAKYFPTLPKNSTKMQKVLDH